jgi:peptide deformylase
MILPIKKWPDEILLTACSDWNFDEPATNAEFLMADMIETMIKNQGIGLAANQVGLGYRVVAMYVLETDEYITLFNPVVVEQSELRYVSMEGCLSFPNVFLDISRPRTVTVKFFDHLQREHIRTFKDTDAKCISHEIEHLDGKTFKQHVSDLRYAMALKKGKPWH